MSDRPAGWYPDPDGENRQRYWDGDGWTEYYTPLAPEKAEIHGAATATTDYPYLASVRTGSHHAPMAGPGRGAPAGGWPAAAPTGAPGETLEFSGAGSRSSAGRWAMVAASVLVVGLVAALGWWAFGSPGGTPTTGPTTSSTAAPTDGETVTGDVAIDGTTTADLPAGGAWVGSLDLDATTTLLLDARAGDDLADLWITVSDAGGQQVAGNDDRGGALSALGGNALNPLLVATLDAGSYDVSITDRSGVATAFDLAAARVTTTLELGTPVDGTAPSDGVWAAVLEVETAGDYRIDVTGTGVDGSSDPDPLLVAFGPDERQLIQDDRSQDERDPLLEDGLAEGTWVLLVSDYFGRELDLTVEVTTA